MSLRTINSSFFSSLAAAIVAAAFFSPRIADAGVLIDAEQTSREGTPGTTTSVAISDGKARMESVVYGQTLTMIYRSDKDLFWIFDDSAGTYREITRSDMGKVMKQVDKALKEVREKFETLPPEQRKLMEQMLENPPGAFARMMGSQITAFAGKEASPGFNYVKIGDGGEVNGWKTVKYKGERDGAEVSEVWTASASEVNVGSAEMKTLEDVMSMFREFAGKIGVDFPTALGPEGGLQGLPVKVITYFNGTPSSIYTVKSIEQKNLPESEFEVPAGYRKETLIVPESE